MHVRRRSIGVSGYGLRILDEEYENSLRILTDSSFKIFCIFVTRAETAVVLQSHLLDQCYMH